MNPATKSRIGELFPGDENKKVRHALYSDKGLNEMLCPTDDDIINVAVKSLSPDGTIPNVPTPAKPEASPVKEGEVLDASSEAKKIHKDALTLVAESKPLVVNTAEDYLRAEKDFAVIKKMIDDNEAKRKVLKAPILEAGRLIDAEFKAAQVVLEAELERRSTPMKAFKLREREELREQEDAKQKAIAEATAEAQRKADEAKANLEATRKAEETIAASVSSEQDPFLAALMQDDLENASAKVAEAVVETREALVSVAMAPQRVEVATTKTAVVGSASRVSYPWLIKVVDEDKVDRSLCSPDTKKITALSKSLKEKFDGDIRKLIPEDYPGLEITEDVRIGSR